MSHYTISEIRSMDELREMFPTGKADEMNWVFLSTSGVHGSYVTLDQLATAPEEDGELWLTVLVVAPRMVRSRYGEIQVTPEDFPFLRGLVASTIKAVIKSQEGNLPEPASV